MPSTHEATFPGLFLERVVNGWWGMVMRNASAATAVSTHDAVCFYMAATAAHTWLQFKKLKAGDTKCGGGSTFAKTASRKVVGIAMENIATHATGRISMCGPFQILPVHTPTAGQYLKLSTDLVGKLQAATTTERGQGIICAHYLGATTALNTPNVFVYPFRM